MLTTEAKKQLKELYICQVQFGVGGAGKGSLPKVKNAM